MKNKNFLHNGKTVALAINPFEFDQQASLRLSNTIDKLYGGNGPPLRPIFVLNPSSTSMPLQWFDDVVPRLAEEAEARVNDVLEAGNFMFSKPEIIVDAGVTAKEAAKVLASYSAQTNTGLVIVPTVRKSWLQRMFTQSFSDAIRSDAQVPVLVLNTDAWADT